MVTVGNVFAAIESAAYSIRGIDHYSKRNTQMVPLLQQHSNNYVH